MHKIYAYLFLSFLCLCLILIGCGNQGSSGGRTGLTYSTFVQKLQQKGISTTTANALNADMFSGIAHGLIVHGMHITTFEYETDDAMEADAHMLSSDGSTIHKQNGEASVNDWIAPPHFYKSGRILVFYMGSNTQLIALLQSILGPQFAGH